MKKLLKTNKFTEYTKIKGINMHTYSTINPFTDNFYCNCIVNLTCIQLKSKFSFFNRPISEALFSYRLNSGSIKLISP